MNGEGTEDRAPDRRLIVLGVFALIAIAAVVAVLIGRSGGDDEEPTEAGVEGCRSVDRPDPKSVDLDAPRQDVKRGDRLTAVVQTSCGSFEIDLDTERAPKTVNSFVYLAREGVYDSVPFHRIVPGFVIQGGDPLGDGTGGPGYSVDEQPPPNLAYTRGVVAMAKSAAEPPGRSGSQFFVVTNADAALPPQYALLGRVTEGLETVERIAAVPTRFDEQPRKPVLIDSVKVETG